MWIKTGEATFSAVSTVSIDNCFSNKYTHYQIVARCLGSSAANLLVRMRGGGSDASGSNYRRQLIYADASATAARTTGDSSFIPGFGEMSTSESSHHVIRMSYPFLASPTIAFNDVVARVTATVIYQRTTMAHDLATSYDGITAYPASGTVTGTITVYGLRES